MRVARLNKLLPFVAIGTVADCQSVLEPTNRLLIKAGLKLMQQPICPGGLKDLLFLTGLQAKIDQGYQLTSQDLAFILSPILNSSGRLTHARLSIRTLLADPNSTVSPNPDLYPNLSQQLALELIETNTRRKEIVSQILREVDDQAKTQAQNGHHLIWLEGAWSKGIVGLLASRLVTKYELTTIVVALEDNKATASLRGVPGYHLPQAMQAASKYLLKFGGHPQAAGFSTTLANLPKVREIIYQALEEQTKTTLDRPSNTDCQNSVQPPNPTSLFPADFEVPAFLQKYKNKSNIVWLKQKDLTAQLLAEMWLLDPFGQGLPLPELIIKLHQYQARSLGQGQHLRIEFNGLSLTAFHLDSDLVKAVLNHRPEKLWALARVTHNTFRGQTTNQLIADKIWLNDTLPAQTS